MKVGWFLLFLFIHLFFLATKTNSLRWLGLVDHMRFLIKKHWILNCFFQVFIAGLLLYTLSFNMPHKQKYQVFRSGKLGGHNPPDLAN